MVRPDFRSVKKMGKNQVKTAVKKEKKHAKGPKIKTKKMSKKLLLTHLRRRKI